MLATVRVAACLLDLLLLPDNGYGASSVTGRALAEEGTQRLHLLLLIMLLLRIMLHARVQTASRRLLLHAAVEWRRLNSMGHLGRSHVASLKVHGHVEPPV